MEITGYNTGQQDKRYLRQLLEAAKDYNCATNHTDRFYEISFFYRNKSEEYFRDVRRNNNVLKTKQKDKNGDPKSPINCKISGVFLSVALFRGEFPTSSPFGDTRVHIPIEALFRESTNLYFSDFYCTTSENHYVTLVLTTRGSKEDDFCMNTLLKLDPVDNPFLRRPTQYISNNSLSYQIRTFSTVRKSKFFVEVFYTEDIHLNKLLLKYGPEMVFYSKTGIIGKGHSTWGGLRKNASCGVCNPPSLPAGNRRNQSLQPSVQKYGTMRPTNEIQRPTVRVQPQIKPPTNTAQNTAIRSEPVKVPKPATIYQPPVSHADVEFQSPRRTVYSSAVYSSPAKKQRKKGCCTIL